MLALVLLALGPGLTPMAHENSTSASRVVVEGARVELELRCQTRSVIEALDLDTDLDGELSDLELESGAEVLAGYVTGRFVLRDRTGSALPGQLEELKSNTRGAPFDEQWVSLRLGYRAPAPLEVLRVEVSLFREQNPFHRDACALEWNGAEAASWLFGIDGATWDFEPAAVRRPRVLVSYLRLGLEHLLGGWDHIAFVLALLVAARSVRGLIGTVTAFTLAHSVTLALAVAGLVDVPAHLVELAVAMSVAYVGVEGLLVGRPGSRAFEAFCFGLVHGLGFASFQGESLLAEPLRISALVGFNLGVEVGQLLVVLAAVLVLRWVPGDRSGPEAGEARVWLAPRWLRLAVSSSVAVLGSAWFAQRAGWLG